uniref:HMA domain-containing protein n=1 Tax=Kalanchoe fedtschenkoi TaxID=63787 RepID=A0A7N0V7F9_KALFE
MPIVEMKVSMDCSGCEHRIRKALQKLDGVEMVEIDMETQKVTVTGTFSDQLKVLKKVRRTGRRAELWPFPYNPEYDNFASEYYDESYYQNLATSPTSHHVSSYNYHKHGYDGHSHGRYHQLDHLAGLNQPATVLFSEDNPHFCSIM